MGPSDREASGITPEVRRELAHWAKAAGVELMVLFGSSVRPAPDPPPDSAAADGLPARDVDVALAFATLPPSRERLKIIGELQDRVAPRRADVVFLHRDTSPVLRFEVFRGGVPLFEAAAGKFAHEAFRALALYEDALPFRRLLRQRLRSGMESR